MKILDVMIIFLPNLQKTQLSKRHYNITKKQIPNCKQTMQSQSHRVEDHRSHIPIDLSNRHVHDFKQAVSQYMGYFYSNRYDGKLEIIANDSRITSIDGIQIASDRLVSIKLHNNAITTLNDFQNLNFPYLQKLYLEYNQITSLRGLEFSNLPSLTRLSLNNNQLTSERCDPLTKLNAPKLQVLLLDNNNITSIKFLRKMDKNKNLIDIGLSNNQIVDIGVLKGCHFLEKLSKLELQGNRIARVPNFEGNMANLRKMILRNNEITTIEGFISCSFPLLQSLDLENNLITNISTLARIHMPKIIDIKLTKNKITKLPINQLRYGTYPLLQQIILKNNQIAGGRVEYFMIPFADVKELRQENYKKLGGKAYSRFLQEQKQKSATRSSRDIVKEVKKDNYNDNKVFSMMSTWKNKLINTNDSRALFRDMKNHFNKLSFLEF